MIISSTEVEYNGLHWMDNGFIIVGICLVNLEWRLLTDASKPQRDDLKSCQVERELPDKVVLASMECSVNGTPFQGSTTEKACF